MNRVEVVSSEWALQEISRGWKKKSLLSVQPLKRVSTEVQAQVFAVKVVEIASLVIEL